MMARTTSPGGEREMDGVEKAASMDSQEKSIQFLGRLVRTDKSKKKVYLDDLHYPGNYLDRHGKHRKQYYQRQELKVILLDKLWKKHPNHSLIKS